MSVKISVIIPVYNVEAYVERCLLSLLNQTYTDFEAIVVNDGSTDRSGLILDKLKKEDLRLRVFHKKNEGVSRARNFAMQQAEGEFFCFLDADDTYQPEMLETLIREQERTNSDMVVTSYSYFYENTNKTCHVNCYIEGVYGKDEALRLMYQPHGYRCYLVTKLFKKNIIRKNGNILSFRNDLRMMEDLVFVTEYVDRCRSVAFINQSFYNYLMRENSAIHTLNVSEKVKAFEVIIPFVISHFNQSCSDALRWTYYVTLLGYASDLINQRKRPGSDLLHCIKNERNYFLFSKKYSVMGYLKHLVREFLLRLRLLFI